MVRPDKRLLGRAGWENGLLFGWGSLEPRAGQGEGSTSSTGWFAALLRAFASKPLSPSIGFTPEVPPAGLWAGVLRHQQPPGLGSEQPEWRLMELPRRHPSKAPPDPPGISSIPSFPWLKMELLKLLSPLPGTPPASRGAHCTMTRMDGASGAPCCRDGLSFLSLLFQLSYQQMFVVNSHHGCPIFKAGDIINGFSAQLWVQPHDLGSKRGCV